MGEQARDAVITNEGGTVTIAVKNRAALDGMRRAGALVAETLALLRASCSPGMTTNALNHLAHEYIVGQGGIPSFLGFPGPTPFPGAICASVNETIVHGIPDNRALLSGDLISLDVGAIVDGWHGDAAITVPVGDLAPERARLITATEEALAAGIAVARAGNRLRDISAAVERVGLRYGYGIVEEFTGHGIGREMHEPPTIPNRVMPGLGSGPILQAGMTFTIEPIFTLGAAAWVEQADGWTVVTANGEVAAHCEHTIAIRAQGAAEILTKAH